MTRSQNIPTDFITSPYYIEGLYIDPSQNIIIENNETRNVQPKVMEVLTYLCSKAEQVVTADELIKVCWPNQYISDSPLHKCIAQIRKALGDDPKAPHFIKTVPKKGYLFIAKVTGLKTTTTKTLKHWAGGSPYPGLKPYTLAQSDIFFGREQVIEDISSWVKQLNENDTSWLSLSATVGAGKSSLVHAGLLPSLMAHNVIQTSKQNFCNVVDLALTTSSQKPHVYLLAILLKNGLLSPSLTLAAYTELLTSLLSNPADKDKTALFQSKILTANNHTHSRFVVFIDHLERLFNPLVAAHSDNPVDAANSNIVTTAVNEPNNAVFFLLLQQLLSSKKCFLITAIRTQYIDELTQATLGYKADLHYKIPGFSHTELIDIIEKPMELATISYEYNSENRERLNSEIIQQLQNKPVPIAIVQFLLAQLYQKKSQQLITHKAYKEIGGIAGCLATVAEHSYQTLTVAAQNSFTDILFRLLTLSANGEVITSKQPCPIKYFTDKNQAAVVNEFINTGIFQLTVHNEQSCIYLAHFSLLTAWPRISQWLKANISTLYVHHDLKIACQRWLYNEKSSHLLIHSNKKINEINHIIASNNFTINHDEKSLIALSTDKLTRTNRIKKLFVSAALFCFLSLAILSVSLVQKNEQISTTRTNAENLISFILHDLKDKLAPLGKLELLNIVASKTLNYFELAGTENLTGTALTQWAEALHILGEVNISKNNFVEAEAFFKQTNTALAHALASQNNDKNINQNNEKLLELAMLANYWLGYAAYLQLDYATAEPYWDNYLEYANTLIQLFPNTNWQLEQSYALNNLGSLAEKAQQLTKANDYFAQSVQVKLALLKNDPNNKVIKADLADTRSWQSNLQAKAGNLKQAITFLHEALSQVESMYLVESSFENIEHLADVEHKLALLYYDAGDLNNALDYSKKAENKIQQLANNDDENYLYKKDLLWRQLLSIQIFIHQNKLDQALVYLDKARGLINQLSNTTNISTTIPNKSIIEAHAYLLQQQAQTMMLLQQNQSALIAITEAIKLFNSHLSVISEPDLYANIVLTKLIIISANNMPNTGLIQQELATIKALLEAQIKLPHPDYKALAAYSETLTFMQQLQLDKQEKFNKQWLNLYQNSDYNIPNFLSLN